MLTQHIALVPDGEGVNASELARVSAALQKQVTRDLWPIWGIAATVDAFPYIEDVPIGYWPIVLTFSYLGGHEGVQLDRNGQPFAQVQLSQDWSLFASRACLEMLVNPYERCAATTPSLRSDQGPVELMIEVCAACEHPRHAYVVNDVLVSDFCTPEFYQAASPRGGRHSFAGSIDSPLQLRPGGHLTWYDPISGSHWLRSHWGENPSDTKLGAVDRKVASVRELVNACAPLRLRPQATRAPFQRELERARIATELSAQRLRSLLGDPLDAELEAAIEAVRLDRGEPRAAPQPLLVHAVAEQVPPATAADDDYAQVEIEEFEEIDTQVETRSTGDLAGPEPPRAPAPPARPPSLVSLAPAVVDAARDRSAPHPSTVLAGALAAAGLFAIVWSARGPGAASEPAPVSAAAPARAPLSKSAATAAMLPVAGAAEALSPPPAQLVPAAAVAPPQAKPRPGERVAAERSPARRRAVRDLPAPPSTPEHSSRPSASPSVEELIETRR